MSKDKKLVAFFSEFLQKIIFQKKVKTIAVFYKCHCIKTNSGHVHNYVYSVPDFQ